MVDNISSSGLIVKIYKWRKKFLYVSVVSFVVTATIVLILPKQYKSTAVLFASRHFSVSKLVIEANSGNQEDYMQLGDEDDCEKLIQVISSDELKLRVANAFDLWTRWDLTDSALKYHYLKQKWQDMVIIKRTEFNSIKVEVYDYTPEGAAEIANGITDYCDTIKKEMSRQMAGNVLKIVKEEYDNTLLRMKVLEDSLNELRQLGVLHYKEQVKAYSKSYAKAIEKNDLAAMKRLESKLDTLKKYGNAYQTVHDNLEKYSFKYPDIKGKYDEALVNYNSIIPMKFVVEKAKPNQYKEKPKRIVITLLVLVANNLITLLFLLVKEKFNKISFK
ncbi:MAG: hypothetical protein IPM51_06050 [Sphingobacteriaceae bacterium]|nr:hypothetical protein [Sphingobacteriaceae bacterium]